jgi:hypothetical protein
MASLEAPPIRLAAIDNPMPFIQSDAETVTASSIRFSLYMVQKSIIDLAKISHAKRSYILS